MKKSFMNNIKHFVDSNVRQRIDRAAHNNSEFFSDELLLVERQFEDIRHVCMEAEKRISAMMQSLQSSAPLGAYTQNVQASLNNLSSLNVVASSTSMNATTSFSAGSTNLSLPPPSPAETICQSTSSALSQSNDLSSTLATTISAAAGPNMTSNHQSTSGGGGVKGAADELRDDIRRHKKLPIVGYLKFLVKSCYKLKPDSLLFTALTHCSNLQTQLTKLYLSYERTIEAQCLTPIQQILEIDVPNVIKLRKLFIKSHNDLESVKAKYNGACQKQLQQQQHLQSSHFTSTSYTITQSSTHHANINKLDQLRKELDEAVLRFEQARDTYATELYSFVCRETELVNLFMEFYQHQADYQQQVLLALQGSLPKLSTALTTTPRKVVFGTSLEDHLHCTGRSLSLVIEVCIHLLYSNALNEEGLFRIPGSSVKIKKLKSAINAWFITLASQSELANDQQQVNACHSSVLAIHDLFKNIVGQTPQNRATIVGDVINNQATTVFISEDSTFSQNANPSSAQDDNQQIVYDVHTIAGLLKLYLRELPEPLFTYALYQQWIDATVKTLNKEQPEALEQVIEQLPKANRDNLRLLIRFLHLLTSHHDLNKMTASNLAITMAPSLIWSQPSNPQQSGRAEQHHCDQQDDLQNMNIQMSNMYGISAPLHTLVIENLIKHAEKLLSGEMNFKISSLDDSVVTMSLDKQNDLKQGQCLKSASPTELSTASSSSFSSSSNASAEFRNRGVKGRPSDCLNDNQASMKGRDPNRPKQVHPPPVPPAPAIRSHLRQPSDSMLSANIRSFNKLPPRPPPTSCNPEAGDQNSMTSSQVKFSEFKSEPKQPIMDLKVSNQKQGERFRPVSLRGTGSILSNPGGLTTNLNAVRPSVPPPNRPIKSAVENQSETNQSSDQLNIDVEKEKSDENDNHPRIDSKRSHILSNSGSLRGGSEDLSVVDIDEIDISSPVSPIVSLDSISDGDSSFDNEYPSLENPWAEDKSGTSKLEKAISEAIDKKMSSEQRQSSVEHQLKPAPRLLRKPTKELAETTASKCAIDEVHDEPPVKPPRSMSPKATQSTPL